MGSRISLWRTLWPITLALALVVVGWFDRAVWAAPEQNPFRQTVPTYDVTVTIVGNGTVNNTPGNPYNYNETAMLQPVADPGWTFAGWSGPHAGDLTDNGNGTWSLTMDEDKAVTATFTQDEYTLTINIVGSGSVTKIPDQSTYHYGDTVDLEAFADLGWTFDTWSGDLTGSTNPDTITTDGNKTVTATFTQDQYTLTVSVNPSGSGSVTKDPDQAIYTYGQVVELTATPATGWSFDHWSGALSGSDNPETITMGGNRTVTAHFTQDQYTLTVNVNPSGSGSVTKDPDQATYTYGQVVELMATPATGWSFDHWSGALSGSDNPETITMRGNGTVTATLSQYHFTLTVNAAGSGSVTKDPDQAVYTYGQVVELTATPATGWSFDHWSGALSGSDNPETITMYGNRTVTAHFTQDQYTLTVNVVGNGSVTNDPDQVTYHYGDVVTLTATPGAGWTFDHWSGALSGSDNPETITMYGNRTVTAHFTHPAIAIAKTPDSQMVLYDSTVTFTITVTNTGDVTLTNVTVSDALAPNCAQTVGTLAAGISTTYICARANVMFDFINNATVTGTPPVGDDVSASDTASVDVINPDIRILKTADPTVIYAADTVTYAYTVTNPRDDPLSNVSVSDNRCSPLTFVGGDTNGGGVLDPGETWTYTCSTTLSVDTTNTATATADDSLGNPVTDTDMAFVDVLPTIVVTKTADPTSRPEPGGTVIFTVCVTNTSAEAVTLTSLVDDVYGNLDGQDNCSVPQTIAATGSYQCAFTATVSGNEGDIVTDTVTAQAHDDENNTASDDDDATVTITNPSPTITSPYIDDFGSVYLHVVDDVIVYYGDDMTVPQVFRVQGNAQDMLGVGLHYVAYSAALGEPYVEHFSNLTSWGRNYMADQGSTTSGVILATAYDWLGNPATQVFTYTRDTDNPTSVASSPQYDNGNPIVVTYSNAADTGSSGLQRVWLWYRKDSGTWAHSGSPAQTGPSGSFDFIPTEGEGTYYFASVATDNVGNQETLPTGSGDAETIFDTTKPSMSDYFAYQTDSDSRGDGIDPLPGYYDDPVINLEWDPFTDNGSGPLTYHLGTAPHPTGGSYARDSSYDVVSSGTYSIYLTAEDNAGNISDDAVTGPVVVDTELPQVENINCPDGTAELSFGVGWSATDQGPAGLVSAPYNVQYNVDGVGWRDWITATAAVTATFGPDIPTSVEHGHTYCFRMRAVDEAGNVQHTGGTDCTEVSKAYGPDIKKIFLPIIMAPDPNWGFETGDFTGWQHGGQLAQSVSAARPHTGTYSALLGSPSYRCNGLPVGSAWLRRSATVPSSGSPTLSFWYRIYSQDKNSALSDQYDLFAVYINGSQLVVKDANTTSNYGCSTLNDLDWKQAIVSLNDYQGQTIQITFYNYNRPDKWYNTYVYIDDVSVQ